ncbi:MAG TPA: DUF374 domain-containing protein [Candidatus Kapabacteria bacterium]|nr:DUF374 domain-containing protein [Candidatus Kapabacteria bacterium]
MIQSTILAFGVSALVRTLRIRWEGEALPERAVVAFWHAKMLTGWWVSRSNSVAMVSRSKDGEYLSSILSRWKYKLVRGSSGKGGMEALDEAMDLVRSADAQRLVITPDGPQGPAEIFKRGAFIAANGLDLPLYFLEIEHKRKKILSSSWDKFEIPYPFSSVIITPHRIDYTGYLRSEQEQAAYLNRMSLPFQSLKTDYAD